MNMAGSILPSEGHDTLELMDGGPNGCLQVRRYLDAETYALAFRPAGTDYWSDIAMHPNGYSCHELGKRIHEVWAGARGHEPAMRQWQYIKDCGGLTRSDETLLIVMGSKK